MPNSRTPTRVLIIMAVAADMPVRKVAATKVHKEKIVKNNPKCADGFGGKDESIYICADL